MMMSQTQPFQFSATLTGAQEVPPVSTAAMGIGRFGFNPDLTALRVELAVTNINQATVAHIHVGRPGENGPIVLFLFGPAAPSNIGPPTLLTNGTFTASNLTGPMAGMPLSALAAQMLLGNTYANVHTTAHPNGETRGQIIRT